MSFLWMTGQRQLNRLFHLMVICAVLGPTLGVTIFPGFRMTGFRVLLLLLVGGWIIHRVRHHSLESSPWIPVRWYVAFFACWAIYGVLSLFWAGHWELGLRYTSFLIMMLLLCLSFPYFIHSPGSIRCTSRILFGVFFVLVIFGWLESLTAWHLPVSRYSGENQPYPTSFFTNQNDFATAITLGLPFLVTALYMLPLSRWYKGVIYGTGVIALVCLFMTGSRSNSGLVLPLMALVWGLLIPFTVERWKFNRTRLLQGVGLILLAILLVQQLTSLLLVQPTREKLGSTLGAIQDLQGWNFQEEEEENAAASGDQSIHTRKALIIQGLRLLHQSHYLGVGAGNIEYYMQAMPGVDKTNIHNWWAEVLVNFGVVIFIPYMALYFLLLYRLWRLAQVNEQRHLSPWIRWGATSSLIALIGYFFGGMAPSTAIHFTPMWVVLGFALAVVAVGSRGEERSSSRGRVAT
ncbi:O-antigen ligase family protein [Kroppenstedtia sanguinis]